MGDGDIVIEFFDSHGKVAARVSLPGRAMFWSDGRFERGEAFGVHQDVFRHVEEASRRFQGADAGDVELDELERAWRELNERFEIRERGRSRPLADVGLTWTGTARRFVTDADLRSSSEVGPFSAAIGAALHAAGRCGSAPAVRTSALVLSPGGGHRVDAPAPLLVPQGGSAAKSGTAPASRR